MTCCELNPIEMVSTSLYSLYYYLTYLQYWGWCKYRYREVNKKTFQDAKDTAKQYLEACPTEVIRRFINSSWRFMSAYRLGLTGHAAAWGVKKQKQHRRRSQYILIRLGTSARSNLPPTDQKVAKFWPKNLAHLKSRGNLMKTLFLGLF